MEYNYDSYAFIFINLKFWVIGRLIDRGTDSPEEVYVCFHESIPQSAIEMAFKLSLGTYNS